jgi:hypothetical protein
MQRKRESKKPQPPLSREQSEGLRSELDVMRARVHAAKIAYLNRVPFQDKEISFEDLKEIAKEYIQKSYAYQKAVFGKVNVRISVAKLLR